MAGELKIISDAIKPILSDLGYRRKGNMFYKVSDGLVFCFMVEHPGLYFANYFIIPLYMPQDYIHLTYGDRLKAWWDGEGNSELFISQVLSEIQKEVIPFFNRIDNTAHLLSFLQQDYRSVTVHFACPWVRLSFLAAYTALMLHDSQTFHGAVSETKQLLSAATFYSRNVIAQLEAELCDLERLELLPDSEIDQYFQVQITQTLQKLFPKYKK